jgi:hypothetical protein
MRRTIALGAALLLSSSLALAQAGTNNNSTSQQEIKPATGRAGEILLSPDINQKITGNVGYTEGATPDVSSYNAPATAGAVSSGAESTAAVTTAGQMTRQFVENEVARGEGGPPTNGEAPPNAFNQGPAQQNDQPSAQQDKQHPGAETHARTSSSQREKTKAGDQSKLPQGDEARQNQSGQNQSGQASQEPNYKSDHNSVSNRKDYSGKTSKRSKKAEPIENGFHKPGAPVKRQAPQGRGQNQGQASQQPPR